jgi:hypothetical protein
MSWTEEDGHITTRAGRWTTVQVGRYAGSVNEVAGELGCDWHTVDHVAYGEALLEADTERISNPHGQLGLTPPLIER